MCVFLLKRLHYLLLSVISWPHCVGFLQSIQFSPTPTEYLFTVEVKFGIWLLEGFSYFFLMKRCSDVKAGAAPTQHTLWQRELNTSFISTLCVCLCVNVCLRQCGRFLCDNCTCLCWACSCAQRGMPCVCRVLIWGDFVCVCLWRIYDSFLPASSGCLRVWLVWRKPDSLNHTEEPETDVN